MTTTHDIGSRVRFKRGDASLTGTVVKVKQARRFIKVTDDFGNSRVFVERYHDLKTTEDK